MQLSAIPSGASTFTFEPAPAAPSSSAAAVSSAKKSSQVGTIHQASNDSIYLNGFTDSRTYIMPVSDALKEEHWAGWGEDLQPMPATLTDDCQVILTFGANKYLQRYGFYVQLTPEPTGGQIQWPSAWAVEPPAGSGDGLIAMATEAWVPRCNEEWYREPCPIEA